MQREGQGELDEFGDPRKWLSPESKSVCRSLSKQQEPHMDINVRKTFMTSRDPESSVVVWRAVGLLAYIIGGSCILLCF